jgi:integrase
VRKNLTEAFVKAVTVPKLTEFWDEDVAGFVLRVTPSGTKTWAAYYRHLRRPRKYTIGTWPTISVKAARHKAKGVLHEAQDGGDPAAERKADREAITFGDLTEKYLSGHAKVHKRASSVYADQCMINSDLAAWKNRKAADIGNRDVTRLLEGIVRRGAPIKANRTLALVSKIYRYAIGTGLLDRDTIPPTYLVPRPGKECSRERVLSDAEIKKLWQVCESHPNKNLAAFFKLALLTGQRAREILGMAKAEVDFELGEWTVPANRDDHKGVRENLVPLGPTAMSLIESLKSDHPFIFSARSVKPAPIRQYNSWVDDIRIQTGMTKPKGHPEHFTEHDLRRTLQTNLTKMGISRFLADKITNHADASVGGIYDRYEYKNEKRDALTRWDARLAEIVAS